MAANVRLHPFEGSNVYCERCALPKGNTAHKENVSQVTATFPDGTKQTWWITGMTKDELTDRLTRIEGTNEFD